MGVVDFTSLYHGSTSVYLALLYSTMALIHLLDCTSLYHGSTSIYLTSLILTLLHFAIALLDSILFYHGLYYTVLKGTTVYHKSTWLYFTLLHLPWLYFTLLVVILPCFYIILFQFYVTLLDSTSLYHVVCLNFCFSFCVYCSISVAISFTPMLV